MTENVKSGNDAVIWRILFSHSGGYEEYHILGYSAVYSVECQPTIRRNIASIFKFQKIS
jgi:hypothetical protein